jgi:hypothetical protein
MKRLLTTVLVLCLLVSFVEARTERYAIIEPVPAAFNGWTFIGSCEGVHRGETLEYAGISVKIVKSCQITRKIECIWIMETVNPTPHITYVGLRDLRNWKPKLLVLAILAASATLDKHHSSAISIPAVSRPPAALPDDGRKRIVMIDLKYYLYGLDDPRGKVYMNGSVVGISAVLAAMGHNIAILDFNLDQWDDERTQALLGVGSPSWPPDLLGISVIGSPYLPSAIEMTKRLNAICPGVPVVIGGKVIEKLERYQFKTLFAGTNAVQYREPADLAAVLGVDETVVPSPFEVPFTPVWDQMPNQDLRAYLSTEATLVNAQGCGFQCKGCAADKNQRQVWMPEGLFRHNLLYLANKAKKFKLSELSFYMSDLDAAQNWQKFHMQLEVIADVRRQTGVNIRVRCLSSTKTFVIAARNIPNLGQLLKDANMEFIGFGIDGTKLNWKEIGKPQNDEEEVVEAFRLCRSFGVGAEALLVLGYPGDTPKKLLRLVVNSAGYALKLGAHIRPYVYKCVPGNDEWQEQGPMVLQALANPQLFLNLDFAACGSRLTHPRWQQRWVVNATYLGLLGFYHLIGKCPNYPLFPQWGEGWGAQLAQVVNQRIRWDR